jgi:hypothetical protein
MSHLDEIGEILEQQADTDPPAYIVGFDVGRRVALAECDLQEAPG